MGLACHRVSVAQWWNIGAENPKIPHRTQKFFFVPHR